MIKDDWLAALRVVALHWSFLNAIGVNTICKLFQPMERSY
jgi:hypothetical protein